MEKKNLYITHKYCGVQSGVHFIIYEHWILLTDFQNHSHARARGVGSR